MQTERRPAWRPRPKRTTFSSWITPLYGSKVIGSLIFNHCVTGRAYGSATQDCQIFLISAMRAPRLAIWRSRALAPRLSARRERAYSCRVRQADSARSRNDEDKTLCPVHLGAPAFPIL